MTIPATLIAVDPSIRSAGVALFRNGRLHATERLKFKATKQDIVTRVEHVGRKVGEWLRETPDVLVIEWPQIYRAARAEGNPNNILPLAGVCGAVACEVGADENVSYLPREWAGNTKKKTTVREAKTSPRARWILKQLSGLELLVWESAKYNDEVDAIGLGLFHLGRLPHRTRFAGAS